MSGQDGEGPTTEDIGSDHRVFWAVNMAFLVLGFLVCGLCWRFQHSRLLSGQFIVDLASAEAVRRQAEDKQTEIPPKERTIRLEASFARNNVTMVRLWKAFNHGIERRQRITHKFMILANPCLLFFRRSLKKMILGMNISRILNEKL